MTDYQKGKIYRISGGGKAYYGSTVLELDKRYESHQKSYNKWKDGKGNFTASFLLFDDVGINNCVIELVELYPCASKKELHLKEGEWIKKEPCVNIRVSGRDKSTWYRETTTQQNYRKENKEKIKAYRDANKEKARNYRLANKEALQEKSKEKYRCECGSDVAHGHKSHHNKTKKHLAFLAL